MLYCFKCYLVDLRGQTEGLTILQSSDGFLHVAIKKKKNLFLLRVSETIYSSLAIKVSEVFKLY